MLKHILFLMLMSLIACNTSDQLPDGIFFHEKYFKVKNILIWVERIRHYKKLLIQRKN